MPATEKRTPTFPPMKTDGGRIISAQSFGLASSVTLAQCLGPDAAKIAADLCRAANAHDPMVNALKLALAAYERGSDDDHAAYDAMRATLELAEPKGK